MSEIISFAIGVMLGTAIFGIMSSTLLTDDYNARNTVDILGMQICKDKGLVYSNSSTIAERYKKVICTENKVIYDTVVEVR